MPDNTIAVELARLGHRAWCERMLAAGWKPGEVYDEAARVHDALKPFDELLPAERRAARIRIESENLPDRLIQLAAPDRSSVRPFDESELRVGLPVAEARRPKERGEVTSWQTDDEGAVVEVTVRWRDGSLESFDPLAGVVRRA